MNITGDAIYENGVLKPVQAVPLQERERVQITIQSKSNWVLETYGMLGWKGTAESAEKFASDPDLDYPPPAEMP